MLGVGAVPSKVRVTYDYCVSTSGCFILKLASLLPGDAYVLKLFYLFSRCIRDNANDGGEIVRGIPPEVAVLECPDAEVKRCTLNEFQLLDDRFQATLEKWEEQHRSVLRCLQKC